MRTCAAADPVCAATDDDEDKPLNAARTRHFGETRRGPVVDKIVPLVLHVAVRQCRRVDDAIACSNDVVPASRKIGQIGHANGSDIRSRRDRFRRAAGRDDVKLIAGQARNEMPADKAAGSGDDDALSAGQSCTIGITLS